LRNRKTFEVAKMNEHDFRDVMNAIKSLEGYDQPWAVFGGWAIDLYRNASIIPPCEKMIISSLSGISVLAPELVLLYEPMKPEDASVAGDFQIVTPRLSSASRNWLAAALRKLNQDHHWLETLS
jgi:hypothetical protein